MLSVMHFNQLFVEELLTICENIEIRINLLLVTKPTAIAVII